MPTAQTPHFPAMTRFFVPLALQAASQGLTYPLVAMVASRGAGGPLNLAGLAQSNTVMFLLGTLGFGLVTTGMVFGRTREGFARFFSLSLVVGLSVIVLQAVLCIPFAATLLFERIIGLPPSIARPAHVTLLASLLLQFLFFLRIPYQVALYNARAAGTASVATLLRIVTTALLSFLFCRADIVGPLWAIVALTLPVAMEVGASRFLASPHMKRLETRGIPPSMREMFLFNLPISIGGYLLSFSAIILGAFIARAIDPERMLPVYYLALGLATPMAYGATRVQEVVLAFPPRHLSDRRTLRFALGAGLGVGLLPLLFILPGLDEFYYVSLQSLPAADLGYVRVAALALVAYPLLVALRAQGEGLAAWRKKPLTVVAGQAAFMGAVVLSAGTALTLGVPGNLIGPLGLSLGNLASTSTLRMLLSRVEKQDLPVPPTTTASGQIR